MISRKMFCCCRLILYISLYHSLVMLTFGHFPLLIIKSLSLHFVENQLRSSFYPASLTDAGKYFPAVSTWTWVLFGNFCHQHAADGNYILLHLLLRCSRKIINNEATMSHCHYAEVDYLPITVCPDLKCFIPSSHTTPTYQQLKNDTGYVLSIYSYI